MISRERAHANNSNSKKLIAKSVLVVAEIAFLHKTILFSMSDRAGAVQKLITSSSNRFINLPTKRDKLYCQAPRNLDR